MIPRVHAVLAALLLSITLAGCSGGGSVGDTIDGGGTSGTGISTGISQGSITGFGSVIVNGTAFDTSNTTITVNGEAATLSDLRVGFLVRIEGDLQNAVAERLDFVDTVRGPIASLATNNIDALEATLSVLGQTVRTNALTNFVNAPLGPLAAAALQPGDTVAVSGFRDATGDIVASSIERKSGVTEFTVAGPVSQPGVSTFMVGQLNVDFSNADLGALPQGTPTDGSIVIVRGGSADFTTPPPSFEASVVTPALELNGAPNDNIEVEALVIDVSGAPATFEITGLTVATTAATVFENGTAADIQINRKLEIEGVIDQGGLLQASRIVIKPNAGFVRIEAPADAVDPSLGTVTLLGIDIEVNASTRLEDKSDTDVAAFGLDDIRVNDRIEMRGFLDGTTVVATRLEREDPDTDVRLQGPVEAEDEATRTVTILGITVTGVEPGTQYQGMNDEPISQDDFHSAVGIGSIVKAKWDPFSSTSAAADELEIEQ